MSSRDNLPNTSIAFDEIERIRAHYSLPKYVSAQSPETAASRRHNEFAKDMVTPSRRATNTPVTPQNSHVRHPPVPASGRPSTSSLLTSPSSRQRPPVANLPAQRSLASLSPSPSSQVQYHVTTIESNSMPSDRPLPPLTSRVTRRSPSPSAAAVLREVDMLLRQPAHQLPVDALKALVARARALSPQTSLAAAMEAQGMAAPTATPASTPPAATTSSASSSSSSSRLAALKATLDSICALPSPPPLVFTHHPLTQQPLPLAPYADTTARAPLPPDAPAVHAQLPRHTPSVTPPQPSQPLPDASPAARLSPGSAIPLSPPAPALSRPSAHASSRSRPRLALTPPSPLSPSLTPSPPSPSSLTPLPPLSPYAMYACALACEDIPTPPSPSSGTYATLSLTPSPCIDTPLSPLSSPPHLSPHTYTPPSPQRFPEPTPPPPPPTSPRHTPSDAPGVAPPPASSSRQPATTTAVTAPLHPYPLSLPVRLRPRVILPRPKPRPLSPVSPPRPRSRLPRSLFHLDLRTRTRSPPSHRAADTPEETEEGPLPALLPPSVIAQAAVRARASLAALDDQRSGVGIAVDDDDADDVACSRVERAVQALLRAAVQDAAAARARARRCRAEQRWSEGTPWRASMCAHISERPFQQQYGATSAIHTVETVLRNAAVDDASVTDEAMEAGASPLRLDASNTEVG